MVLIANEGIDSRLRSVNRELFVSYILRKPMTIKIRVSSRRRCEKWSFGRNGLIGFDLAFQLQGFSFGKWHPLRIFQSIEGLRYKDPLSSYLFVLVMEAFNEMGSGGSLDLKFQGRRGG